MKSLHRVFLCSLLVAVFLLASCQYISGSEAKQDETAEAESETLTPSETETEDSDAPVGTEAITLPPVYIDDVPAQPISFSSVDKAISFIKNGDVSMYEDRQEWIPAYSSMINTFMEHEKVIRLTVDGRSSDEVLLFPKAKYEDVGIRYLFREEGNFFSATVYFFDESMDFSLDLTKHTYLDYIAATAEYSLEKYRQVACSGYEGHRQPYLAPFLEYISFQCVLDEDRYLILYSNADEQALLEFAEKIVFDEILLK